MFDLNSSEKAGTEYRGFVLVSADYLPDLKTKAYYLRHRTTGLEIYYIVSDDRENLFSFSFRTAAKDSYGAAHIIEHSVLCGSEKFPLKEPFTTLEAQSVKTFLNAMTYPDKTVYPASSLIRADYFNLMDVYADAVFFPLLSKNTFMQEGHRLEIDEKGKLSVQGVVYNEMKANYASFSSVAISEYFKTMYGSSYLACDSGGDPCMIPELTYEQFIAFHKKFYRPDNCLLFLYGNIPLTEQIDFLVDKGYLSRMEKKFGIKNFEDENTFLSELPLKNSEILELQKVECLKESQTVKREACKIGSSGSMVTLNWYTGPSSIEKLFLSEILIGNDSSPVSLKLQEAELGDGMAPACGNFALNPFENLFSLGVVGVKKGSENKVKELIWNTLNEIYNNGVPQKEIDSALMGIDFALRDRSRCGGPFALNYMRHVLNAWVYFKKPDTFMSPITEFEKFKEKLLADTSLLKTLLKKYFLSDQTCIFSIIEPSAKYTKCRLEIEKNYLKKEAAKLDKAELSEQLEKLHALQQKKESAAELECIPHLKLEDLEIEPDFAPFIFRDESVPFLFTPVQTNGIVYMELCFPLDKINPCEFKNIKLFSECISELGWGGKNWKDCFIQANCIAGDIWSKFYFGNILDDKDVEKEIQKYSCKQLFGRQWITLSSEFLESKAESVFKLLAEIVSTMDFSDKKRFLTIFREFKTTLQSGFVNNSTNYAILRAESGSSINTAISEILGGITQYKYISELSEDDAVKLLQKFKSYYNTIVDSGCFIHITADNTFYQKASSLLPALISSAGLKPLVQKTTYPLSDYMNQIYFPKDYDTSKNRENLQLSVDSGCAVMSFKCGRWLTKQNSAEDVIVNWLNSHSLWEKIRLTGAAYGAACSANGRNKVFSLYSWHDPTPQKTITVFLEILKDLCEHPLTKNEIEKSILTCYGDRIVPDGPASRGSLSVLRFMNGTSYDCIKKDMELLISVNETDVQNAAMELYKNALENRQEFIICSELEQICGNIINIRL